MFDPTRFVRLAAATWAENRRQWAWFLGVVGILFFVWFVLLLLRKDGHTAFTTSGQVVFYFAGLFVSAPVFASRYFASLGRPESALVALMRPASVFEKWLLAVLVVVVAYPLAYTAVFVAIDVPTAWIALGKAEAKAAADALAGNLGSRPFDPDDYRLLWSGGGDFDRPYEWVTLPLMLLTLQGFALLGSLVFRAAPALKTLLAAFIVMVALIAVDGIFGMDSDHFVEFWSKVLRFSDWRTFAMALAWLAIPAWLWAGAFVALREREVA